MKLANAATLIVAVAMLSAFGGLAGESGAWPTLRADASASGRSPSVGAPFLSNEAAIARSIEDLAAADAAAVLRARVCLKRSGAEAVPALKAAIEKKVPSAGACKEILDGLASPEILWKLQCDEFFTGSPALDEKAVYAADRAGILYAADKLTGRQLWKTRLPAVTNCTPVPAGDSVYIGAHDGSVSRVRKADGSIAWTFAREKPGTEESPNFVWDSVSLDDRNVYLAAADGKVLAVTVEKGARSWEFAAEKAVVEGKEQEGRFYCAPLVCEGKVYAGSVNGKFYCLDAADGKKVWEYPAGAEIRRSAAADKDLVFFVAGSDLVALDRVSGQKKWAFASERKWRSHPTVYDRYVMASGEHGRTYVLESETGRVFWSGNLPDAVDGTLAAVNDRIYYNSNGMTLGCANLRTGGRVWTFSTPAGGGTKAPSPAVEGGIVYITTRATLRTNNPNEVAVSKCIVAIVEPSDNLYGLNPLPLHWNLAEVHRRALARHNKPYQSLKDAGGVFQAETLAFNDPKTGSEILKLSDDPSANYHHSCINRPSYNANGSRLVMHSGRSYYPGRYVLDADGSNFRRIDVEPFVLNYGVLPCWDRKEPDIVYTNDKAALYKLDVKTLKTAKVCDLPDPDKGKSIFSYPTADNSLILLLAGPKVYLARTDGGGVTTIDLPNPKAKELAPKHEEKWEQQGAHDIYFTLSPENTICFNYGPTSSVGEGIFYEMDPKGQLLRVVYPYNDPGDRETVYYSHPGWRQDGQKVAYFGYGGRGLGWGFFVRDRDGKNPVKLSEGSLGGHCGWDNYDDEWVFASPSVGKHELGGTISRFRTDGSITPQVVCYARPDQEYNGSYSAIPRVAPSPDGTKAVFSSAMMGSAAFIDMYSVAVKRPDPPVKVAADGKMLSWEVPRRSREIMGCNVYRSADGKAWTLATPEPIRAKTFAAPGDGLYAVTSVEWSGLESLAVSGVAAIGNARPAFFLDAEYAEYAVPIKERRDMAAANWFAIENAAAKEGKATLRFVSPAAGDFAVFARVKDGAWAISANDAALGDAAAEDKGRWTWVKLPRPAAVRKGANAIVLTCAAAGAAIDKVAVVPGDEWKPAGCAYLDEAAPTGIGGLKVERLDRALVKLAWAAPAEPDVRFCNVYYAAGNGKPALDQTCRIASLPRSQPQYLDFAPQPGAPGSYAVTAVDRFGNEGKPAFAGIAGVR